MFRVLCALLLLALVASIATAQNLPVVAIDVQPATAIGTTPVTITWSCTNSATARASGGWSGLKALSGSEALTGVTTSRSYCMTCRSDVGPMRFSWLAATKNQDGSLITNLAGYKIFEATTFLGVASTPPTATVGANVLEHTLWLPAGTHYVGVRVTNTDNIDSVMSNIVNKSVAVSSAMACDSIAITPRPAKTTVTLETN